MLQPDLKTIIIVTLYRCNTVREGGYTFLFNPPPPQSWQLTENDSNEAALWRYELAACKLLVSRP